MSPAQLQIDPAALDASCTRMDAAVEELVGTTQALLGEVSDVTVLGTNDTLGSIASILYQLVIERVQETIDSVQEEFGTHSDKLREAKLAYEAAESGFAEAGSQMVGDL